MTMTWKSKKGKEKKLRFDQSKSTSNSFSSIVCSTCKLAGHSNSSSTQCSKYKSKLKEAPNNSFGSDIEQFTINVYLESVSRVEKKKLFKEKVVKSSVFISNVIFRLKILVNSYLIDN